MKTPSDMLDKFERASIGLDYGKVTLTLIVKQGQPRYIISREESYIPNSEQPTQDEKWVDTNYRPM